MAAAGSITPFRPLARLKDATTIFKYDLTEGSDARFEFETLEAAEKSRSAAAEFGFAPTEILAVRRLH